MSTVADKLSVGPFEITISFADWGPLGWRWRVDCGNKGISSGSANTEVEARRDALCALMSLLEYWKTVTKNEYGLV